NCINGLGVLGSVAAIMIGATAGAGDRGAGVLRDLVATGAPRWRLFATRVPAVLALVVPLALAATLAAALLANGLRSGLPAVGAGLAVKSAAWVAAAMVVNGALAAGVASLLGSQSTSIGLLLGWHLAASHLLVQVGALGDVRWW